MTLLMDEATLSEALYDLAEAKALCELGRRGEAAQLIQRARLNLLREVEWTEEHVLEFSP